MELLLRSLSAGPRAALDATNSADASAACLGMMTPGNSDRVAVEGENRAASGLNGVGKMMAP